jgi:hypothetical protein
MKHVRGDRGRHPGSIKSSVQGRCLLSAVKSGVHYQVQAGSGCSIPQAKVCGGCVPEYHVMELLAELYSWDKKKRKVVSITLNIISNYEQKREEEFGPAPSCNRGQNYCTSNLTSIFLFYFSFLRCMNLTPAHKALLRSLPSRHLHLAVVSVGSVFPPRPFHSTSSPFKERKMPPKKKVEDAKPILLGRPSNNLKVCYWVENHTNR